MCADYGKKEVHIKHLGFHPSRVANKILNKGDNFVLGPMGWLELCEGKFKYHVHFGERLSDNESVDPDLQSQELNCQDTEFEDKPPAKKMKTCTVDSQSIQKTLCSFVGKDPVSSSSGSYKEASWREHDTLLIFEYRTSINTSKIAAFDLDNTIIETASGRKFATGPSDWKLMTGVLNKLKSYSKESRIVFLSNQLGISKGKPTKAEFKQKVEAIAEKLQISFLLLASTTKDLYRKPCTGMWDHLVKFESGKNEVDMKTSFYVGDAAGRDNNWMPGNSMQTAGFSFCAWTVTSTKLVWRSSIIYLMISVIIRYQT